MKRITLIYVLTLVLMMLKNSEQGITGDAEAVTGLKNAKGYLNEAKFNNWRNWVFGEMIHENKNMNGNLDQELSYLCLKVSKGLKRFQTVCFGLKNSGAENRITELLKCAYNAHIEDKYTDSGFTVEDEVIKPSPVEKDLLFWFGIGVIGLILTLWMIGLFIQYTSIGNKRGATSEDKIENKKSKIGLFFLGWSPAYNLTLLFATSPKGNQKLNVLDGFKVMATMYIIQHHLLRNYSNKPAVNFQRLYNVPGMADYYLKVFDTNLVTNVFFFISGFLIFYILTSKFYPTRGKFNYLKMIIHRYVRLVPAMALVLLIITGFVVHIGTTPNGVYIFDTFMVKKCKEYWWTNLTMIANYHPYEASKRCYTELWYVQNDFIFYSISLIVILVYCKKRKIGYILGMLLISLSLLANTGLGYAKKYPSGAYLQEKDHKSHFYRDPFLRMSSYFIGGFVGFAYFEFSRSALYPELKKCYSVWIYNEISKSRTISIIFLLAGLYIIGKCNYDHTGLNKSDLGECNTSYTFAVGLIIVPTLVGRLRLLIYPLSFGIFEILGKLSYTAYLFHQVSERYLMNEPTESQEFTLFFFVYQAARNIIVVYLCSIPLGLMAEFPFQNLDKFILFSANAKKIERLNRRR